MTAAELKASILDLAIRGKLVRQNPGEESASLLLARIKNEMSRRGSPVETDRRAARCGSRVLSPIAAEEKPFDIPDNWTWVRLGEITNAPVTYGIIKLGSTDSHGVKVFRSSDVKPGYIDETGVRTVTKKLSDEYSRTILNGGEIVLNVRGTLGGCAYVEKRFANYNVAREVAVIRPSAEIDAKYLMWCLISQYFWQYMGSNLKGIAYKGLNIGLLVLFPIPLPPLAEQKRIVAKIEKLMPWVERYGKAEEKRLRLDAELPEKLRESLLKSVFDSVGDGTPTLPFVEACAEVFTGNSLSELEKRKFARTDGLPFIGTKDVGFDGSVAYDNGIRIPAEERGYRTAAAGASLMCIEGGSSGRKLALLTEDVRFGNKLCAFVPGEILDPQYLNFYLKSPQFKVQFAALQDGPRKGVGLSEVKKLLIPVPLLDEQQRIVDRIKGFFKCVL